MTSIIPTTQVQQNIGKISATIGEKVYIVTNRGEGRIVMLPYFDGCDEYIRDYMEDFQMYQNRKKLKKEFTTSHNSGPSSLII